MRALRVVGLFLIPVLFVLVWLFGWLGMQQFGSESERTFLPTFLGIGAIIMTAYVASVLPWRGEFSRMPVYAKITAILSQSIMASFVALFVFARYL